MNARGVTRGQLEQAAAQVGVRLSELREVGKGGRGGYSFTLKTGGTYNAKGRLTSEPARYRRLSPRTTYKGSGQPRTIPGRVCWHGHRAFLRALYRLAPDAKVRTAMAVYTSAEHFEATHATTYTLGGEYMGYRIRPERHSCTCPADDPAEQEAVSRSVPSTNAYSNGAEGRPLR